MTASDHSSDVLIVGGGPGGASLALRLLDAGLNVVVIEREEFPRFHIGESMTGECGQLVRELGFERQMQQAVHPNKHGVRVWGSSDESWWLPMATRNEQLQLVEQSTWSVRRSTFDAMLLDEVRHRGGTVIAGKATQPVSEAGRVVGSWVRANGKDKFYRAQVTADCSGQATWLASHGVTGPKFVGTYSRQLAVFSQLSGYERDCGGSTQLMPGNTHIFYKDVYHWAWAIPLDDDITSVGVVASSQHYRSSRLSLADYWAFELGHLNRELEARADAEFRSDDVHAIPNYSYQVSDFVGPGYVCVGDSHRFVDPIFSFGLYVALSEARLASSMIVDELGSANRMQEYRYGKHTTECEEAIDRLEDMIDFFWSNPLAFASLVSGRYREPLIDLFSGRIYSDMRAVGRDETLSKFRQYLGRDRTSAASLRSIPIGSRFLEGGPQLWSSSSDSIETTELWMRD